MVRDYEHENFANDKNMETKYYKKAHMGVWTGGTSGELVAEMKKAISDARTARGVKGQIRPP